MLEACGHLCCFSAIPDLHTAVTISLDISWWSIILAILYQYSIGHSDDHQETYLPSNGVPLLLLSAPRFRSPLHSHCSLFVPLKSPITDLVNLHVLFIIRPHT